MMKQELGEKDLADKYFTRWKNKVFKGKKKKKRGKKKDKKTDKNPTKKPDEKNGKQTDKPQGMNSCSNFTNSDCDFQKNQSEKRRKGSRNFVNEKWATFALYATLLQANKMNLAMIVYTSVYSSPNKFDRFFLNTVKWDFSDKNFFRKDPSQSEELKQLLLFLSNFLKQKKNPVFTPWRNNSVDNAISSL